MAWFQILFSLFLPYSCPDTFIDFEFRFLRSVKFFLSHFFFFSFYLFFFLAPDLKKVREGGGGEEMGQNSVSQLFLYFTS